MKIKFLLSIVLSLIMICSSFQSTVIPTSNWILDIKNEKGENGIVLKPNVLTKIIFVVSHEDNIDIIDYSFDNSLFTIVLENDDDIKLFDQEINIVPSASRESYAYIGLKSDHKIDTETYELKLIVKSTKDLDGNDKEDAKLTINPVQVTIVNEKSLIEIEPIETDVTGKGYSLFRLKNEIFNMEKIVITLKDKIDENFIFKNVEIKGFKDRNEYGENENDNHGIIFDFPFGTEKSYEKLEVHNTTINLIMQDDKESNCFELSEESKSFIFMVNQNELIVLNDSVKEAIVYTMENITPKRDLTNNIQISMTIPVAPVLIECELKGEGKSDEGDISLYRDYILKTGSYLLKFEDLNSNNEYKAECKFITTNFDKTEIKIKIGNDEEYDFITPLYPSRTNCSIPQCIEFTFTSKDTEEEKFEENVKRFADLAQKLCHKTMTEDKNIISRIMGNYKCEKADFSEEIEKNKKNRAIICVGASPSFKSKKFREYLINENSTYFEDHVNQFVEKINTNEKIQKIFENEEKIKNLELSGIERYYDINEPNKKNIEIVVDKEGGTKKKEKIKFKIISTNSQPIECFYNDEMKKDDKKKYIDLHQNKGKGKSITLYPNEQKIIETKLTDFNNKKMYTLYMNCYNLPGAKIRYEQTGVFIAYTYLYTENEDEQSITTEPKVTINCAEKNNRINPHCLKGQYNQVLNKMKTKIPEIDIEEEVEKFNKLSNGAQLELLQDLSESIKKEGDKIKSKPLDFFKKAIQLLKHLKNRDCSLYSSGNTNDIDKTINNEQYKKCRDSKKQILKIVNTYLKNEFTCSNLISFVKKEEMSKNLEENVKYIILLIHELSNNYDSFNQGESQQLYDMATCFQEKFDDIWTEIENYLKKKDSLDISIIAVKKDLSNLLIQSLANLIKVLHFEEIDNYITDKERNITKTGIMGNPKGKQIHKSIKSFMKRFNEYGTGEYNYTDSIVINVIINDEYKKEEFRTLIEEGNNEEEQEEKVIEYKDKGITVILHPKFMLKAKNAYSAQVVKYDSPIMPIKTSGDDDDSTLDTFISITLYDNKGNEVNVDDLPENIRPKILYNRSYHKYLKHCFFYNEEIQDLDETGLFSDDNIQYDGKKHFRCTTKHLTSFTAGNYYDPNKLSGWTIFLIVLGVVFLIVLLIIVVLIIKKKRAKNNIEDINKNTGTMEIMN